MWARLHINITQRAIQRKGNGYTQPRICFQSDLNPDCGVTKCNIDSRKQRSLMSFMGVIGLLSGDLTQSSKFALEESGSTEEDAKQDVYYTPVITRRKYAGCQLRLGQAQPSIDLEHLAWPWSWGPNHAILSRPALTGGASHIPELVQKHSIMAIFTSCHPTTRVG